MCCCCVVFVDDDDDDDDDVLLLCCCVLCVCVFVCCVCVFVCLFVCMCVCLFVWLVGCFCCMLLCVVVCCCVLLCVVVGSVNGGWLGRVCTTLHLHTPRTHLKVADDVLFRWRSDRQRFPPRAYEARNLVWKGSDPPLWRTFSSAERLTICGFPVTALDEILGSDSGLVEARRNTLVGQGFHLPFTIVLFTIMALEVLGASPALRTDLNYGPAEFFLRRRARDSFPA